MTKHGQTMSEAYKEVLLREDNMDLMKKAAGQGAGAGMRGSMQTLKMKDGKLKMDTFTASAIMQIYKAVNDKNKKTMENLINSGNKAAIMKLQKFAMSKINSSYEVSEHHRKDENGNTIPHDDEEELSEAVSVKDFDSLKKGDTVTIEYKSGMSSGTGTYTVTAKNKVAKGKVEKVTMKSTKNPGGVKNFLYKRDNKVGFAQGDMGVSVVSFKKEEVELDEAVKVGDTVKVKLNRKGKEYIEKGKVTEIEKDSIIVKHDFSRTPSRVSMKNIVKEEVELKEGTWALPDSPVKMAGLKKLMQKPIPLGKDGDDAIKAIGKYIGDDGLYDDLYDAGKKDGPKADARPVISGWMDKEFIGSWKKYRLVGMGRRHSTIEEVELDEGKMKELHGYISQGKSAKEIAKIMKLDVKTIKALMAGYNEGARADARRAMRNDPVLGKRSDKDDDDDEATAADKKAASKNILMQLQKVVSLKGGELKLTPSKKKATAKGNYGKTKGDNYIEFSNGKKEKVDPKVAQAVFKKYMSMQRPIDKQKFTIKISKSYKDMLAALKESLGEAKSPLQKLKDFDKVRVGVGKKPIFKDNEKKDIKEEDEDDTDRLEILQGAIKNAEDRLKAAQAGDPKTGKVDAEKVQKAKESLQNAKDKLNKFKKDAPEKEKRKKDAEAAKKWKDTKLKGRIQLARDELSKVPKGTAEHDAALDKLQNAKDAYQKYKEKTTGGKVKSFVKKTAKAAALGVAGAAKLGDSFDPTIKREAILDRIDKKLQERKDG